MMMECGHPYIAICPPKPPVILDVDKFGALVDGTSVSKFTWRNNNNVEVQVITYGATITSIKLPSVTGAIDDIVMGFDNLAGRVANRVGNAKISINHDTYNVSANRGHHSLHGGFKGFDKVNWNHYVCGNKVVMTYLSKHMEEGYPGDVLVNVSFELTDENEFLVDFKATSTLPTYVNLTNHSYFNLAGHNRGARELLKHEVCINADKITEVDEDSIPTGKLLPVANTIFDLRIPNILGKVIDRIPGFDGFDHNFCVNQPSKQQEVFVARVFHPPTGRAMEVYSNQPGVQFYNSNFLPEDPKKGQRNPSHFNLPLVGKGGCHYYKNGALCLETQNWPDAINHVNFPPAVLYPGETYHHTLKYKFFKQLKLIVNMACNKLSSVNLTVDNFGSVKNEKGETVPVKRFTWTNQNNVSVQLITYGGYITSIKVPDKNGKVEDVVIGFDNLEEYLKPENAYYGATVGRVANRIAKGKMKVQGKEYSLAVNNGPNHLHGGIRGFDKVVWEHHFKCNKVVLSYHSTDGEEGYPGDLLVNITFELTAGNEFCINYKAVCTKATPATSQIVPTVLGDVINRVPNSPGFDHNFCISQPSKQGQVVFTAKAHHPDSGRVMEVYSDQPGVQFYTGNFMPDESANVTGKDGAKLLKHGAFCFETQVYPDSINQVGFPNVIVYPGEEYGHSVVFKFFTV
nr:unnamed protein product [Callosobruchus analis]